ncbi:MAG: PH domain-containing protein [Actinomycetota bacterium]|nr:PH domain-containing protein [Actinomycetota bacterium]
MSDEHGPMASRDYSWASRRISLIPGEQILVACKPAAKSWFWKDVWSLGIAELGRQNRVYVLTNRRVFVSRGIIRHHDKSIPIDKVQDATVRKGVYTSSIAISSAGGALGVEQIGPITHANARSFHTNLIGLLSRER